jgi:hypothetical protein
VEGGEEALVTFWLAMWFASQFKALIDAKLQSMIDGIVRQEIQYKVVEYNNSRRFTFILFELDREESARRGCVHGVRRARTNSI